MNEYSLIKLFYGNRVAQRSQVPLINHIDEGAKILNTNNFHKVPGSFVTSLSQSRDLATRAFILHPIFQDDENLLAHADIIQHLDPVVVLLTLEYRRVANDGLRNKVVGTDESGLVYLKKEIQLSPFREVNMMLAADKIQNYKDFRNHHYGKHEDSEELDFYFNQWFRVLKVDYEVDLYQF